MAHEGGSFQRSLEGHPTVRLPLKPVLPDRLGELAQSLPGADGAVVASPEVLDILCPCRLLDAQPFQDRCEVTGDGARFVAADGLAGPVHERQIVPFIEGQTGILIPSFCAEEGEQGLGEGLGPVNPCLNGRIVGGLRYRKLRKLGHPQK